MLQRRFRIGYNRAARLIDAMEANGVVGPYEGNKPRTVLIQPDAEDQLHHNTILNTNNIPNSMKAICF